MQSNTAKYLDYFFCRKNEHNEWFASDDYNHQTSNQFLLKDISLKKQKT